MWRELPYVYDLAGAHVESDGSTVEAHSPGHAVTHIQRFESVGAWRCSDSIEPCDLVLWIQEVHMYPVSQLGGFGRSTAQIAGKRQEVVHGYDVELTVLCFQR